MLQRGADIDTVEIVRRLIAFRTVSADSNLNLIHHCRNLLESHGIGCELFLSSDRQKANLSATIGPQVPGDMVLSGHTDVVPTEGQKWSRDPWTLSKRDGRFIGRGTVDMKSFLALALVAMAQAANQPLRRPLTLAFSYDEEVGCEGGKLLATAFRRPALVVVGEPSSMRIVKGHKSYLSFGTEVTGIAVHSSRADLGVSARPRGAADVAMRRADAAQRRPFPASRFRAALHDAQLRHRWRWHRRQHSRRDHLVYDRYPLCPGGKAGRLSRLVQTPRASRRGKHARAGSALRINIEVLTSIPGLAPDRSACVLAAEWSKHMEASTVSYGTEAGLFRSRAGQRSSAVQATSPGTPCRRIHRGKPTRGGRSIPGPSRAVARAGLAVARFDEPDRRAAQLGQADATSGETT
jgi:acetylornithine deacetylase